MSSKFDLSLGILALCAVLGSELYGEVRVRAQHMVVGVFNEGDAKPGDRRTLRVLAYNDETGTPVEGAKVSASLGVRPDAPPMTAPPTDAHGTTLIEVDVPGGRAMSHLRIEAVKGLDQAKVDTQQGRLASPPNHAIAKNLLHERDLPIYLPGQRMRSRIFALDEQGLPISGFAVEYAMKGPQLDVHGRVITSALGGELERSVDPPGAYLLSLSPPSSQVGVMGSANFTVQSEPLAPLPRSEEPRANDSKRLSLTVASETWEMVRGIPNRVYVSVEDAYGSVVSGATVKCAGMTVTTSRYGIAQFEIDPGNVRLPLEVSAVRADGARGTTQLEARILTGAQDFLLRTDRAVYAPGAPVRVTASSVTPGPILIELQRNGETISHHSLDAASRSGIEIAAPEGASGRYTLLGYRPLYRTYQWESPGRGGPERRLSIAWNVTAFILGCAEPVALELAAEREHYLPGEEVVVSARVTRSCPGTTDATVAFAALDERWSRSSSFDPLQGMSPRVSDSEFVYGASSLKLAELVPTDDRALGQAQAMLTSMPSLWLQPASDVGTGPASRRQELREDTNQRRRYLSLGMLLVGGVLVFRTARKRRAPILGVAGVLVAAAVFWLSKRPLPAESEHYAPDEQRTLSNLRWATHLRLHKAALRAGQPIRETPLWAALETDAHGVATVRFKAPTAPATWSIAAVAILNQGGRAAATTRIDVDDPKP